MFIATMSYDLHTSTAPDARKLMRAELVGRRERSIKRRRADAGGDRVDQAIRGARRDGRRSPRGVRARSPRGRRCCRCDGARHHARPRVDRTRAAPARTALRLSTDRPRSRAARELSRRALGRSAPAIHVDCFEEGFGEALVELAIRADAAAHVHGERTHGLDRVDDVRRP